MRLEGQNAGCEAQLAGPDSDAVDQRTMAAMHAVEVAYGQSTTRGQRIPAPGRLQRAVRDHHGVVKMLIIDEMFRRRLLREVAAMKSIENQMATYAAYHQDARNKVTHFVGVPVIVLSLFIPLAWLRLDIGGVAISAAMLLAAAVLVYYFLLDVPLAPAVPVVLALLAWPGERIAMLGPGQGRSWLAALFVGGWILQLVGHVYEGRRPALADNLFQIFVAPIFLVAEAFFALGYKPRLREAVQRRAMEMRAAA